MSRPLSQLPGAAQRCLSPSAGPWGAGHTHRTCHSADQRSHRRWPRFPADSHGQSSVPTLQRRLCEHPLASVSAGPAAAPVAVLGGPLPGLQPGGPMVWPMEDARAPLWRDRTGVRKPSCSAWKKVDDRRAVIYTPESPQDQAKLGLCGDLALPGSSCSPSASLHRLGLPQGASFINHVHKPLPCQFLLLRT